MDPFFSDAGHPDSPDTPFSDDFLESWLDATPGEAEEVAREAQSPSNVILFPPPPGDSEQKGRHLSFGVTSENAPSLIARNRRRLILLAAVATLVIGVLASLNLFAIKGGIVDEFNEGRMTALIEMERRAEHMTPNEVNRQLIQWRTLMNLVTGSSIPEDWKPRLHEAGVAAGIALRERGIHHLAFATRMDFPHHIALLRNMDQLLIHPALPMSTAYEEDAVGRSRHELVNRTMNSIVDLSSPGAGHQSLSNASFLSAGLAQVAPHELRGELLATSQHLARQARVLRDAVDGGTPGQPLPENLVAPAQRVPVGDRLVRENLASAITGMLDQGEGLLRAELGGERGDELIIRGELPGDAIAAYFQDAPELLRRLREAGFRSIQASGMDQVVEISLSSS